MSALDKLIEAVDEGNSFGIIPLGQEAIGPEDYSYKQGDLVCNAFSGSLDAALALHEALLPGWSVTLENDDGNIHAAVWPRGEIGEQHGAQGPTLARALLLAILRAYRQQRGSGE